MSRLRGLLSLSSADHSEIAEITTGLADQFEGTNTSLSLPSTRVDAFNIELANELTRNGRRSGLTFAPEGGSERIRRVINKMVSEEDLIRTVTAAYSAGWRQVKLYFMCGLPTETDEDVLQIARLAREVIRTGRQLLLSYEDLLGRAYIGTIASVWLASACKVSPARWAAPACWLTWRNTPPRLPSTASSPRPSSASSEPPARPARTVRSR